MLGNNARTSNVMKRLFCNIYNIGRPVYFFTFAALVVLALVVFGFFEDAILFVLAFSATFGLVGILKLVFHTPRPEHSMVKTWGSAFPSGHAVGSTFFAVMLSYYAFKTFETDIALFVGIVLVVLAAFVAVSRVFLRAHTAFQVSAGILIGLVVPLTIVLYETRILQMLSL